MKKIFISLSIFLSVVILCFSLCIAKPKAITGANAVIYGSPVDEYLLTLIKTKNNPSESSAEKTANIFMYSNEIRDSLILLQMDIANELTYFTINKKYGDIKTINFYSNFIYYHLFIKKDYEQETKFIYIAFYGSNNLSSNITELDLELIRDIRIRVDNSEDDYYSFYINNSLFSLTPLKEAHSIYGTNEISQLIAELYGVNGDRLNEIPYNKGYNEGYNKGLSDGAGVDLNDYIEKANGISWFTALLQGFDNFFSIHLGPVTIGQLFLIPISISMVWFIIRLFRGGGGD